MAQLQFSNVTFAYEGSYDDIFTNLTFSVDTDWRLGLIGRNGRGKTTLLRLIAGKLQPTGNITIPLQPTLYPFPVSDSSKTALTVMSDCAPDEPQWRLQLEANLLEIDESILEHPFHTLSRGEQTKVQLAALFARDDAYPLIDEPTNHLDLLGRQTVSTYLAQKQGFLLVSHDRAFMNHCIDHTLSLNKSSVKVQKGNFDSWEREFNRKNQTEAARNEHLKKDITRLKHTARVLADRSHKAEKGKFHVHPSESAAVDRGYVGARAAAMMKRSLVTRARIEQNIEEKQGLLQDIEHISDLKLSPLHHPKHRILEILNATVRYGDHTVCTKIRFSVEQGNCVALVGGNGSGKSSILKSICGLSDSLTGDIRIASNLKISYVPQSTEHLQGSLDTFITESSADETLFKAILRQMDFGRQQFDKEIARYSDGQKKKLLLARSLCESAHLYIWDEPLNYIDVFSRVQLEKLILDYQPTMLVVEHDRAFLERICTDIIKLQ